MVFTFSVSPPDWQAKADFFPLKEQTAAEWFFFIFLPPKRSLFLQSG